MATKKETETARQAIPSSSSSSSAAKEEEKALGGGGGQGVSSIQVIQKYSNTCVLQVSRGTGPRALEEWIAVNQAICFAPNHCSSSRHDEKSSSQSRRKKPKPEKPVLASPHYSAYAQSLVLIARRPQYLEHLHKVTLTIHCLVKGNLKQGTRLQWTVVINGNKCAIQGQTIKVAPSNTAGYITLLSVQNDHHLSTGSNSCIAPRLFRKALKDIGYPVLGNAKDACSFRGESLCMSVVRLEFHVSGMEERHYSICLSPAPRLRALLEREERFWRERNGIANESHNDVGVAVAMLPPEYASGTATFGGLEFHVTPSVMIPRKGTEALVERAMFLYNKTHRSITRASILDLGTGSGCVLLTLLDRIKDAYGVGIDVSPEALAVAEQNAAALGLADSSRCYFLQGSFEEPINLPSASSAHHHDNRFNLVVCNPPYHTRGGRKVLDAATVAHEPDSALYIDNKDDYLIHYRHVLKSLHDLVTPKAVVVFEVFRDNAEGVATLMRQAGLTDVEIGIDANGCIRTAGGIFPDNKLYCQQ
jgi:release factor glutamine methyltransferase